MKKKHNRDEQQDYKARNDTNSNYKEETNPSPSIITQDYSQDSTTHNKKINHPATILAEEGKEVEGRFFWHEINAYYLF